MKRANAKTQKKALDAMPVEDGELMGNSIEEGIGTVPVTERGSIPEQVNATRALELINERRSITQSSNVSTFRSMTRLSLKDQFERDYEFPPTANSLRTIDFPDEPLMLFVRFLGMSQVMRLRKLNRHWFVRMSILFHRVSNEIEDMLLEACGEYFTLTHSNVVFSPTAFGK